MQPNKHWELIEEIYQAALERDAGERSVFVAQACKGDEALRREIESLLSAYDQASGFLLLPALEIEAKNLAAERADGSIELQAGQEVSHYRVLSHIGAGGMGEVFLAEDRVLERRVALKLLPAEFTQNRERLQRFVREAKAASALNHPNIITIHEIGQAAGVHYIATEFIDGATLRAYLSANRMKVREALEVAAQVASALAAAHSAGIVHRDIKPENIMLRPDGYVKVLDFGLAKLTEKSRKSGPKAPDSQAGTAINNETEPGRVLGTINYMSPEQARGLKVDARTDIFSLGVVLYEMVAARRPFAGETDMDVIVSILDKEPPLVSLYEPDAPAELQRIINKALCKNTDERYQTMKDLWIDLKNLKEELAFEAKLERSASLESQQPGKANKQTSRATSGGNKRATAALLIAVAVVAALVITGALILSRLSAGSFKSAPASEAPSTQIPEQSLSYWITVQKYRDSKPYQPPFTLASEINFEKDYRIRLNFESEQPGYLYILNEGPVESEPLVVLFPSSTANGGLPAVREGRTIQIPEQSSGESDIGWFRFDKQEGVETIWLVWSAAPVSELQNIKADSENRGEITSRDLNNEVKGFLKSGSTSRPIIEKDDKNKVTRIRSNDKVLIHSIRLEHN